MAAFLYDLDGTTVKFATNLLIDGKLKELQDLVKAGHQIIFLTARGYRGPGHIPYPPDSPFSIENTKVLLEFLEKNGVPHRIMYGVLSPRIAINDAGAMGITCERDLPLPIDLVATAAMAEQRWAGR